VFFFRKTTKKSPPKFNSMPLHRKTFTTLPTPVDVNPIPTPKLTFKTQAKNASFPTGGLFSTGSIKFSLNNVLMVEVAKAAFEQFSLFKGDTTALNKFLLALSITSKFEGGFDAVNTYDVAGVSLGFIQLARPEGGVGKLFRLLGRQDIDDRLKNLFGTADPHASSAALLARNDKTLLSEIVSVAASPDGIKAQFAMAVNQNVAGQLYFDKAYKRNTDLNLKDPLCAAMLFDAAVNMGAGSVNKFKAPVAGQTEGDWIAASANLFTRPERKAGWKKIVVENFV
jgi:hypothetical protein